MRPQTTRCPNPQCGKTLRIPEGKAGSSVKCPACMRVFQAPPALADSTASAGGRRGWRRYAPVARLAGTVAAIAIGIGWRRYALVALLAGSTVAITIGIGWTMNWCANDEAAGKPQSSPALAEGGGRHGPADSPLNVKEEPEDLPEMALWANRPIVKLIESPRIPFYVVMENELTVGAPRHRSHALPQKLIQEISENVFWGLQDYGYFRGPTSFTGAADVLRGKLEPLFAARGLRGCSYQTEIDGVLTLVQLGRLPNLSEGKMRPYMVKCRNNGGGPSTFSYTEGAITYFVSTPSGVYSEAESGNLLRRDANGNYVLSRAAEEAFDTAIRDAVKQYVDVTSNPVKKSVLSLLDSAVKQKGLDHAQVTLSGTEDFEGVTYTISMKSGAATWLETQHFRLADSSRLSATRTLTDLSEAWSEETSAFRKEFALSLAATYDTAVREDLSYDLAAVKLLKIARTSNFSTAILDRGMERNHIRTWKADTAAKNASYVLNGSGEITGIYCIPGGVWNALAVYVEVALCGPDEETGRQVLGDAATGWKTACAEVDLADEAIRREAFNRIRSVCRENDLRSVKITLLDATGSLLEASQDSP
jgi:hypothetical protein